MLGLKMRGSVAVMALSAAVAGVGIGLSVPSRAESLPAAVAQRVVVQDGR